MSKLKITANNYEFGIYLRSTTTILLFLLVVGRLMNSLFYLNYNSK